MLALDHVTKRFGDRTALADASLLAAAGRVTVLLGPSGCGKSTTLRLFLGLTAPDEGTVRFGGAPLSTLDVRAVRRRTGYVIQSGGLFPHLTARGNVSLGAREAGLGEHEIAARVAALAETARLPADRLARYPDQLSGGERQRVSLMRALVLDPDVLLLDEPLGALDVMIRAELQSELQALFRRLGKTVVLVTHDLAEAGLLADEIVLMRDGRVVQRGPLDDLLHRPAEPFVTDFVNAQHGPVAGRVP